MCVCGGGGGGRSGGVGGPQRDRDKETEKYGERRRVSKEECACLCAGGSPHREGRPRDLNGTWGDRRGGGGGGGGGRRGEVD